MRQNDEIHFLFQDPEDPGDGERVHADRQMLAVIFEHAQRKYDGPALFDRGSNLMRQHHFVVQHALPSASATRY